MEVKIRKLAKMHACRIVVGMRGIFGRSEHAEINKFFVHSDSGTPSISSPVVSLKDALETTRFDATVSEILGLVAFTNIFSAIIKRLAIPVIAIFERGCSGNQSMHENETSSSNGVASVKSRFRAARMPFPLGEPVEVNSIYDSVLTLG